MMFTSMIAKQFRDVCYGGNWTSVNYKEVLSGIDRQTATRQHTQFNSIAKLVFHVSYYLRPVTMVLQGQPLEASDKFSFACPPVESDEDWKKLIQQFFAEAENFIAAIESLPDDQLDKVFSKEQYGNYYRNLHGLIEHAHYHLGQIVILRKVFSSSPESSLS